MNNGKRKICVSFACLVLVLVLVSALSLMLPDREYSENENKYLSSFPSFSLKNLLNGTFEKKYETYLSDQLPGRNLWISLKSACEAVLLKTENNGVIYGKDGYLFQKFNSFDSGTWHANLEAIKTFAEECTAPVTVMAVPSSYEVLTDKVPSSAPFADEETALEEAEAFLSDSCSFISPLETLREHSGEYVYYRTDHHWTTLGAWYACRDLCECLGIECPSYVPDSKYEIASFYGTSYTKCKRLGQQTDVINYIPSDAIITIGEKQYDSIYDYDKISERDKYAFFLHGNNPESVITSSVSAGNGKKLLIIKDSYADCLIPFLTEDYETITCIDPRYYAGSFAELASGDYTDVIILMGFEDLSGETSITKLGF